MANTDLTKWGTNASFDYNSVDFNQALHNLEKWDLVKILVDNSLYNVSQLGTLTASQLLGHLDQELAYYRIDEELVNTDFYLTVMWTAKEYSLLSVDNDDEDGMQTIYTALEAAFDAVGGRAKFLTTQTMGKIAARDRESYMPAAPATHYTMVHDIPARTANNAFLSSTGRLFFNQQIFSAENTGSLWNTELLYGGSEELRLPPPEDTISLMANSPSGNKGFYSNAMYGISWYHGLWVKDGTTGDFQLGYTGRKVSPGDTDFANNGAGAHTITRNDGGSWITDGYSSADRVIVSNADNYFNNGEYTITTVAADKLTLDNTNSIAIGYARDFNGVDQRLYMSGSDVTANMEIGGGNFAFCGWFRMSDVPATDMVLFGRWGNGADQQWRIQINSAGALVFKVKGAGGNAPSVTVGLTDAFAPAVNKWYFVAVYYDETVDLKVRVRLYDENSLLVAATGASNVSGGIVVPGNPAGTPDGNNDFVIGAQQAGTGSGGTIGFPAPMRACNVGMWISNSATTPLTTANMDGIWNRGVGMKYAQVLSGGLDTNLAVYFDLDSGATNDETSAFPVGTITLSENVSSSPTNPGVAAGITQVAADGYVATSVTDPTAQLQTLEFTSAISIAGDAGDLPFRASIASDQLQVDVPAALRLLTTVPTLVVQYDRDTIPEDAASDSEVMYIYYCDQDYSNKVWDADNPDQEGQYPETSKESPMRIIQASNVSTADGVAWYDGSQASSEGLENVFSNPWVTHYNESTGRPNTPTDLLADDKTVVLDDGGRRTIGLSKLSNRTGWLYNYLNAWWADFKAKGGEIDFILSIYGPRAVIDTGNIYFGYAFADQSVIGATGRADATIANFTNTTVQSQLGDKLRSGYKTDLEAGTLTNDNTSIQDVNDRYRLNWALETQTAEFLHTAVYQSMANHFPNVHFFNEDSRTISAGIPYYNFQQSQPDEGGAGSVAGTHTTVKYYLPPIQNTSFGQLPYVVEAKAKDINTHPRRYIPVKSVNRAADGETTITLFNASEITADPTKGNDQYGGGIRVGDRVRPHTGQGTPNSNLNGSDQTGLEVSGDDYQADIQDVDTIINGTATVIGHPYSTGDRVIIYGNDGTAYDGEWLITYVNANSFTLDTYSGSDSVTGGYCNAIVTTFLVSTITNAENATTPQIIYTDTRADARSSGTLTWNDDSLLNTYLEIDRGWLWFIEAMLGLHSTHRSSSYPVFGFQETEMRFRRCGTPQFLQEIMFHEQLRSTDNNIRRYWQIVDDSINVIGSLEEDALQAAMVELDTFVPDANCRPSSINFLDISPQNSLYVISGAMIRGGKLFRVTWDNSLGVASLTDNVLTLDDSNTVTLPGTELSGSNYTDYGRWFFQADDDMITKVDPTEDTKQNLSSVHLGKKAAGIPALDPSRQMTDNEAAAPNLSDVSLKYLNRMSGKIRTTQK